MVFKWARCSLVVVLLLGFFAVASTQARDVIDYLPEVQLARAVIALATFNDRNPNASECPDVESDELPDLLLVDQHGLLRTQDEIDKYILATLCVWLDVVILRLDSDPETEILSLFNVFKEVLIGERFVFPNGDILDGTKQSIRLYAGQFIELGLFLQLYVDSFVDVPLEGPLYLLGSDTCVTLEQWFFDGNTFEQREMAFRLFIADLSLDDAPAVPPFPKPHSICHRTLDEPEGTLLDKALAYDLEASVNLALIWAEQTSDVVREGLTADELDARIFDWQVFMLKNMVKYPALTMAAYYPLANLMDAKAVAEFRSGRSLDSWPRLRSLNLPLEKLLDLKLDFSSE